MIVDLGLTLQYVLTGLAVSLSAGFVVRRQFPQAVRNARIAIAVPLLREGRPPALRGLGRLLAPAPRVSGSACGGCNGCGPSA